LAVIKTGERYKAVVCSNENVEFVVRTSENDMVPSKVNFKPETGKNYYLKVKCAIGVEIASIKIQDPFKGKKEANNGNKFIGSFKTIAVQENTISQNTTKIKETSDFKSEKSFKRIQIIDNFKFEITDIIKAGEMLTLKYKITNLASDDRKLETCANMMYFYDDLGNLTFAKRVCIATSCSSPYIKNLVVSQKYACHSLGKSSTIMPSGIPLNGQIIIQGIHNRASKFVRGTVWFKTEVPFKITYSNILFPKVVDTDNPNRRNFGNQSIELIGAIRDSIATYIHFKHSNTAKESYTSKIKRGLLYDDMGNQYKFDAMSFISKDKRINTHRYFKGWNLVINSGSTSDMYVIIDKISPLASQIKRVTLNFEGFNLSWENIHIKGGAIQENQPKQKYIQYTEFEEKIRKNQNVIGTKVILKKIYFSTGSDVILKESFAQLNQLGELLKLNSRLKVEVSGHTDNVGDDLSNMLLSQKRADAIKYYLIKKSIQPNKIISIGKGEKEPIRENTTGVGRQENRRVEIMVVE